MPGGRVPVGVAAFIWPGFTDTERYEAWESFAEAAEWRAALATGTRHWADRFGEEDLPAGDGPTAAAIKLACQVAAKARSRLLSGEPRYDAESA